MSYFRRAVAVIGQIVALVLIFVFTMYSGFQAWGWAKTIRFFSDQLLRGAAELKRSALLPQLTTPENLEVVVQIGNLSDPDAWFLIGATLGFLISAAVLSAV